MSWGRIDDKLAEHPKWVRLEREHGAQTWANAMAVWTVVLCYANRNETDGEIEGALLTRMTPLGKAAIKAADAMVQVGLMDRTEHGYALHDFLDYNPSKAKKVADRAADAARKKPADKPPPPDGFRPDSVWNPKRADPDSVPPGPARPDPMISDDVVSGLPAPLNPSSLLESIRHKWARDFETRRHRTGAPADDAAARKLAAWIDAESAKSDRSPTEMLDAICAAYWREDWPNLPASVPSLGNLVSRLDRLAVAALGPATKPPLDPHEYNRIHGIPIARKAAS